MKKNKFLVLAMFMSLIGLPNTAHAVPVAVTDDITGQLLGIDGIDLLGDTWNVMFIDKSALAIFGSSLVFDFTNSVTATEASRRLKEVYSSPGFSLFNFQPGTTNGVDDGTQGQLITPYGSTGSTVLAAKFTNFAGNIDTLGFTSLDMTLSTQVISSFVYADWTNVSTIPVPSAVWLMGSGLLGLLGYSRKRSQVAA